ncbi:MAG: 4-hydroxy-tetrahydrodipicolinate synthase [Acidimicrobiaceae bacterium]|jgi:4-hydroxy-tetrahydrodipicolinate synthase
MASRWGAVLTAMVTPFDENGALDLDAAAELARWLQDHGNDGLVVAGTTGEAPVLTESDKLDLFRAVSEAVTIPILAGTGSNNTGETVELTRKAADTGAAGVLVVSPYYNRPPQSGIEAHFRAVADATTLPVMVYDVPGRTGRRIAHDVLVRLFSEVPNIVAFKDATGDPPAAGRLLVDVPSVEIYSGDEPLTLAFLAEGAVGVVGVATHWCAPETGEMISAFEKGDVVHAREINARLRESFIYMNSDTCVFSQAAKAMMRTLGLRVGECRLPLGAAPAGTEERAREVYANLHA